MAGKLIVIEGGDAAGKATQVELLRARIEREEQPVLALSFPRYDDNLIGGLIREWLDGERGTYMDVDARISSVVFAADRFETKPKIEEALAAGTSVVLDRFGSASMLHQAAKQTDAGDRAATMRWIYHLEHEVFAAPMPDELIYLDVPAATRIELMQQQWVEEGRHADVAEMNEGHQTRVDAIAEELLAIYPHHYRLNGMRDGQLRTREDIHEEIYEHVRGILEG